MILYIISKITNKIYNFEMSKKRNVITIPPLIKKDSESEKRANEL